MKDILQARLSTTAYCLAGTEKWAASMKRTATARHPFPAHCRLSACLPYPTPFYSPPPPAAPFPLASPTARRPARFPHRTPSRSPFPPHAILPLLSPAPCVSLVIALLSRRDCHASSPSRGPLQHKPPPSYPWSAPFPRSRRTLRVGDASLPCRLTTTKAEVLLLSSEQRGRHHVRRGVFGWIRPPCCLRCQHRFLDHHYCRLQPTRIGSLGLIPPCSFTVCLSAAELKSCLESSLVNPRIIKVDLLFPTTPHVSTDGTDLISKLLVKDSSKRLYVDDIMKHPWILKNADPSGSCIKQRGCT
ncbi:hypothetical protein GUJ93_ZPchr0004g39364 [Zizania palustris]|uniref:Aurora kinase n=1 Tax=Zizania palustris TaxID=103762 RepID=A0A8J5SEQ1_ZIZPA|nr:hypothetical protein GUJ93_ZPchr0004g39364 [Zizania palustris]